MQFLVVSTHSRVDTGKEEGIHVKITCFNVCHLWKWLSKKDRIIINHTPINLVNLGERGDSVWGKVCPNDLDSRGLCCSNVNWLIKLTRANAMIIIHSIWFNCTILGVCVFVFPNLDEDGHNKQTKQSKHSTNSHNIALSPCSFGLMAWKGSEVRKNIIQFIIIPASSCCCCWLDVTWMLLLLVAENEGMVGQKVAGRLRRRQKTATSMVMTIDDDFVWYHCDSSCGTANID